jgi:DNA (cytosine-5)-methyltransferase 1
MNYYNEFDPFASAWLQNLIDDNLIPSGIIDTRSITEIKPDDLKSYNQCHFFAGIAGWSYALQLAGISSDSPIWTGSCPCQPFSSAGKRQADEDERHLWPTWFELIRECKPSLIVGEQVAAAIGVGWLDRVFDDLESENYTCGAIVLPACSVGAPHIRERLFWVADSKLQRKRGDTGPMEREKQTPKGSKSEFKRAAIHVEYESPPMWLADAGHGEWRTHEQGRGPEGRIADGRNCAGMGHGIGAGLEGWNGGELQERRSKLSPWKASSFINCKDGKQRRIPVESALFPLASGISNRVGILRGAGNSIVPQVAAKFLEAILSDSQSTIEKGRNERRI